MANNKLSFSERGRLGALKLNSDPVKKKAACQKATAAILARNPNHYSDIGKLSISKISRHKDGKFIKKQQEG